MRLPLVFIVTIACMQLQLTYAQVFDPISYGAIGDGKADDTNAVREALAKAAANNGGQILYGP